MRTTTAAKVADVLGLVEAYLEGGRPRKRPGKPRPEAIAISGNPVKLKNKANFWDIEKVSLLGALKMACYEQGYSTAIRKHAEDALGKASQFPYTYSLHGIEALDDAEWDTRQLQRAARAARRKLEKEYSL